MAKVYLCFTILGIVIPFGAFLPWLANNGVNIIAFINAAMVNPISIFAWLDVVIAAVVLLTFIIVDGKSHKVKYHWLAIVGTLSVGVSCGLPLYLYLKEKQQLQLKESL